MRPILSSVQQIMSVPTRRMVNNVIKSNPMLSPEDEISCFNAWREHGDKAARDRIVLSYMPLAMKMVSALKGYNILPDDLLGLATTGLLMAVDKFDMSRGVRFGTCARPWIKEQMLVYIMNNRSIIKGPQTSTAKILFFNMARMKSGLGIDGPMDTKQAKQVADMIFSENPKTANLSAQGVMDYDTYSHSSIISGDTGRNEDGESFSIFSTLSDAPEASDIIDEHDTDALRKKFLHRAISRLDGDRDRAVFIARHIREPSLSLDEIGKMYDVSRERIRQIEARAVGKVKTMINAMIEEHENRQSETVDL